MKKKMASRDYRFKADHLEDRHADDLTVFGAGAVVIGVLAFLILVISFTQPAEAAEAAPFATFDLEHQYDVATSPRWRTGCRPDIDDDHDCSGHNPASTLTLGIEFASDNWRDSWKSPIWKIGIRHTSHLFEGIPFNNNPESQRNAIFIEVQAGGLR